MDSGFHFTEEDFAINERLGYPDAYAALCNYHASHAPTGLTCATLRDDERELDVLFPVVEQWAKPSVDPGSFVSLLWNQLNHLGNAGFDPGVIRVDPQGNVLYFHADNASPLAWDVDHWFPLSRGGLTVASNLMILQWQVSKKKRNKLEFLVSWGDLHLGISVNQFLSFFASSNSDFRHRAFSFMFLEGENEELNAHQAVKSHCFPPHFNGSKEQLGLASASTVISQSQPCDSIVVLKSVDLNRQRIRLQSPSICQYKHIKYPVKVEKGNVLKENEHPELHFAHTCQTTVKAIDCPRQREEASKILVKIKELDMETSDIGRKADEESITIQELEFMLENQKKRVEMCRRLAEAQSSHRLMLEKLIREAIHQNVMYKEHVRLNEAAINALTATLEAQKEICDASEKELHKKFNQRYDLEKHIRHRGGQGCKKSKSRVDAASKNCGNKDNFNVAGIRPPPALRKELWEFLEEQKASEREMPPGERKGELCMSAFDNKSLCALDDEMSGQHSIGEQWMGGCRGSKVPLHVTQDQERNEEVMMQLGKGNVEKWLQMILKNIPQDIEPENLSWDDEMNQDQEGTLETEQNCGGKSRNNNASASRKSFEAKEKHNEHVLAKSESTRTLRRIPSSPFMLNVKKGVDCMMKPIVTGDDDDNRNVNHQPRRNRIIKSSVKSVKKAVKL